MVGGLLFFSCSDNTPVEATSEKTRLNVLLITVDTLRADHLGTYGYERPTSPRLDQLASESIVFEDAQATSSWTLPSLASLMTAVYPSSHGSENTSAALNSGFTTLAEQLSERGYYTGGIVSQAFASRRFGFDRGFAYFDDELAELTRGRELFKKTSADISDKAGKWLRARSMERSLRPWFLWLHYFDPHVAYVPHPGFSEQFGTEEELDLYDGEIAWTDHQVGIVLDGLREYGLEHNTLVVFTSDHGEEFEEHGGRYHRNTLHREVLHVPLLMRMPGVATARANQLASLIDVAPTILALAQAEPLADVHGAALLDSKGAATAPHSTVYAELLREDGERLFATIAAKKWVAGSKGLVGFDRTADKLELKPLEPGPQAAAELDRHAAIAAEYAPRAQGASEVKLTPEEIENLRALGYVDSDE